MATEVYTTEEVAFQDGTEVLLRPLNIKRLRTFMKYMEEFGKAETEDEGLGILTDIAALCVSTERPEYFNDKKKRKVERLDDEKKKEIVNLHDGGCTPEFEEVADMPTIYKIIEVCGGVKLNDPNMIAAAAAAMERGVA